MGRLQATHFGTTVALCLTFTAHAAALTFSFNFDGSVPQDMRDGMTAAGALWEAQLTDNVTVSIDVVAGDLGPGVLGGASSYSTTFAYSAIRAALVADAFSADDFAAVAALPGSAVDMMINRTSDNPNGAGSATAYLDNDDGSNNTTVRINTATAHAIGLLGGYAGPDADITFSTTFAFDYDRGDGINGGEYDFIGVALHELGHVLGFTSGVDSLDTSPGSAENNYDIKVMDLFRYSATSYAQGAGTIDFTANSSAKYFSVDGGATSIAAFSTGKNYGDGQQASHWKDGQGIGGLDPTAAAGETVSISATDLRMFDVLGWDLASAQGAAPEPACLSMLGLLALLLHATGRRRA